MSAGAAPKRRPCSATGATRDGSGKQLLGSALVGADRAYFRMLLGENDFALETLLPTDLQLPLLLVGYALSVAIATAVADLAFCKGGDA